MLTVMILLAVGAFLCALANAARPVWVPLWVSVILLCLIELLRALPLGK